MSRRSEPVPCTRPVVFLGPSLPLHEAAAILDADFRPPIRRGDLAEVPSGSLVAIIDGVFDQHLAVSPREIRKAMADGVEVFGGASMGALRAAEVPGVRGVGLIHAWYRDGVVVRDDEVALLFDPGTYESFTVPTVNVRFAVERLARPGTIDADVAARLLQAATRLPYTQRTYRAIVIEGGLDDRPDIQDLVAMLEAHDLKRTDAQAVLEAVSRHLRGVRNGSRAGTIRNPTVDEPDLTGSRAADEVLIWESGDRVTHTDLLTFLCFTGRLEPVAMRALLRAGCLSRLDPDRTPPDAAQAVLEEAAARWGWVSTEEARVTLADLGIDLTALDRHCAGAAQLHADVRAVVRGHSRLVRQALVAELFLDDLALKREAMRLGSLRWLAAQHTDPVGPDELREATAVVCRVNRVLDLSSARTAWRELGWSQIAEQDDFLLLLARARAQVRALRGQWQELAIRPAVVALPEPFAAAPKPPGEPRFCTAPDVAADHARRLADLIGVTRIGMIGELAELDSVQIAQAARPGGAWSSSYGSGKSTTQAGAKAGAVLEELEKWAQEEFDPPEDRCPLAAYDEVRADPRFVDPCTLDLPYDSTYSPAMPLRWTECVDLLAGRPTFLPMDALRMRRGPHDICFTSRGSRKHLATNGLGAGFSLAEAVLHATCEYIERHAQRLAEIRLVNPGGIGPAPYRFVDPHTGSARVRDVVAHLSRSADAVRVLDITSEVTVPTFMAVLVRDRQRADGFGTHPDPDVAVEMALLEAAQTLASAAAGGREDLSIRSRSLGRHERPRPTSPQDAWFWLDPDAEPISVTDVPGFRSADVRSDVEWLLARIWAAGLARVPMIDLSTPAIAPARVVRVLVPGLETNNPFYTGPRARVALLPDLVPGRGRTFPAYRRTEEFACSR
jgi:ribosomal protein S12 methylthiotransferase accessory factor